MIRYIGAKNNLTNWILETCPPETEFWVEPFGGMFSIFFNLDLEQFPHTRFIYNEINPYHLNLFHHLKDPEFRKILKNEIINERVYLKSFSNYLDGGYPGAISWLRILCGSKDIRNILEPQYEGSWVWWKVMESLESKAEHFNRMEIDNLNYDKCIEKWDQEKTFFYLDPPYFGYEHYYTHHNFNLKEHENLRDILFTVKGEWTLSYYKFPELKEWYQGFPIDHKKFNLGTEYRIRKSA